ncbi:MAG: hypothetical protein RRA32_10990, partial [bacterium]|nr:hypothetical protein [bacterium]
MPKQTQAFWLALLFSLIFTMSPRAESPENIIIQIKPGDIVMQPNASVAEYKVDGYRSSFRQMIQMGGFSQLQIINQSGDVLIEVDDSNGIVPIGDEKYVYAVSVPFGDGGNPSPSGEAGFPEVPEGD